MIAGLLFLIALGLRVFIVVAMQDANNVDEISLGVEAWSLWHTGEDVHGARWPLHFYHYGWGENVVYAYVLAPVVGWLGLHTWALDIPSVLASLLVIPVVGWIGVQLHSRRVGWIAAGIMVFSPWSIQLSRLAFNASIVPLFWLLGAALMIYGLRKRPWVLLLAAPVFALSFYTYGESFVWVPVLVAIVLGVLRKRVAHAWRWGLTAAIFTALLSAPIALFHAQELVGARWIAYGEFMRFTELTLTREAIFLMRAYSGVELFLQGAGQYVSTFNVVELFGRASGQQFVHGLAFFYPWMIVPFLAGFIWARGALRAVCFWVLLLAPFAVVLVTNASPHMLYTLPLLGWAHLMMALGVDAIATRYKIKKHKALAVGIAGVVAVSFLTTVVLYEKPTYHQQRVRQHGLEGFVQEIESHRSSNKAVRVVIPSSTYHFDVAYGYAFFADYPIEEFQKDVRGLRWPETQYIPRVNGIELCWEAWQCKMDPNSEALTIYANQ